MENAKKLTWAREFSRLSQKQLAEVMDTHPKTISRWEQGSVPLPEGKLAGALRAMGLSLTDIPEELKAAPAQSAQGKPASYDEEGYPAGWGRPTLKQFKNDEAMNAYFLKRVEGNKYDEREAYRVEHEAGDDDDCFTPAQLEYRAKVAEYLNPVLLRLYRSHPTGLNWYELAIGVTTDEDKLKYVGALAPACNTICVNMMDNQWVTFKKAGDGQHDTLHLTPLGLAAAEKVAQREEAVRNEADLRRGELA